MTQTIYKLRPRGNTMEPNQIALSVPSLSPQPVTPALWHQPEKLAPSSPIQNRAECSDGTPRRRGGPRGVWVVVLRKVKVFVHGAYEEETWWGVALPCTGLQGMLRGGCSPLVFHPYGHQQPVRPTKTSKTNNNQ